MAPVLLVTLPLFLMTLALTALGFLTVAHKSVSASLSSYLTVNRPVKAEVLIVEGWLSDRALKEAAAEFIRGHYSRCLVSGATRATPASISVLTQFGVNPALLAVADVRAGRGHKTYRRALSARQWLRINHPEVKALNVFTVGPHGRKSWAIFRRVFGPDYLVGVLSCPVDSKDPRLGWDSIKGALNMGRYLIGYVYGLLWPFKDAVNGPAFYRTRALGGVDKKGLLLITE